MRRSYSFLVAASILTSPLAAQSSGPSEHIGNFGYYQQKDPIDDSDRSRVVVVAERGGTFVPGLLGWQCRGRDEVVLYLRNQPYGLGDRDVSVTWRFDKAAPQSGEWSVDAQGFAFFEGDDAAFGAFLDDFRRAQLLAVRTTSPAGEVGTFIFHLDGSERALDRLACLAGDSAVAPPPAAKP